MKVLCCGDFHIRASAPRYRIDDYYAVQKEKIMWIMDLAYHEDCSLILQPGDFFDSHTVPNRVVADYVGLSILNRYNMVIHTIFGQHDLRYRSKSNTALGILTACEAVTVENSLYSGVTVWHSGWEEEIPKPSEKDNVNILLIHKMVTKGGPLWPGQTDYSTAKDFLVKHPEFSLIISGDNHQQFAECYRGRWLINAGSLMRATISQTDHRPSVSIYDTETKKMEQHFIPIRPAEEVFDLSLVQETKERNLKLEAFMERLDQNYDTVLNFEENVIDLLKRSGIVIAGVHDMVKEILGRYHEVNK